MRSWQLGVVVAVWTVLTVAMSVRAQGIEATGRPVAEVRLQGVRQVDPQFVLNQVRVKAGEPYDPDRVAKDIQNITRLGRFASIRADIQQRDDGSIVLTYVVDEQPLLAGVQVIGNKAKTDQELLNLVLLRGGDPLDDSLIKRGQDQIRKAYREAGYFLAEVTIDAETLAGSDVLIFKVREGPKVKVRAVNFEGNAVYQDKQLAAEVGTKKYILILQPGTLTEKQLDADVASVRRFYQDRGYLDIRVGRRIDLSEDQNDAVIVFVIDEGVQYTVGEMDFEVEGPGVFSERMILEAMPMKPGDVYSAAKLRETAEVLRDLYGKLGYLERAEGGKNTLVIDRVFAEDQPRVDLKVRVVEGKQYTVGNIIIRGNQITQDRVVRRELRGLEPGRPYDRAGIERSENRIQATGLFSEAKLTVLGDDEAEARDLLAEVRETKTGSVSFGASVSSDVGLLGAIDLQQRNFDITDFPESWGELFTDRAFRGAGQQFGISLQPGNELQRYAVNWSDPHLYDSSFYGGFSASYFTRVREDFDEERLGGTVQVGKRFGDIWSVAAVARMERIDIADIDDDAPLDVFAVGGDSLLSGVSLRATRSTVDSRLFPTEGTRLQLGLERVGALGGDYDFTRITAEGNVFFTVDEDFFGRKTVLSFSVETAWNIEEDEAPLFERFYAGGHQSFRGFELRGVGPRGRVLNDGPDGMVGTADDFTPVGDDPVGGDFMLLVGTEYNFPIYQEALRGVLFIDSGTVNSGISLADWRMSAGAGIRVKLPFLGQAPFAFDLAYPILKEDEDETRIFSFSVALPF